MTMIEKVARAIAIPLGTNDWRAYVPQARAAIEAMREPSDTMLDVSAMVGAPHYAIITLWQSMIDAALKEPT